jgi:hypothetical protein
LLEAGRESSSVAGAGSAAVLLVLRALVSGACLLWSPGKASAGFGSTAFSRVPGSSASVDRGAPATDYAADKDLEIYASAGSSLIHGSYPGSEYPTGAVALFGFEVFVGGTIRGPSHALLMVAFHLATVAAIWSLRTRWSSWLAAFVAVWPMNAFHWELRYDSPDRAARRRGLALAQRDALESLGVALGVGAALKWIPGLAFLVLAVWLLTRTPRRPALPFAEAFW